MMKVSKKNTFFFVSLLAFFSRINCKCDFPRNPQTENTKAYQKLTPLMGKRYKIDDTTSEYIFYVGICTDAQITSDKSIKEGIVQEKRTDDGSRHVIGKYANSSIMAGSNWLYLEYGEGDKYNSESHCNKAERKAVILFTCDPDATDSSQPLMLEEQTDVTTGCYYLFEIPCREVCKDAHSTTHIGSIILIVFFSVAAVYLIAGALYQRFFLGAKGLEQIPNYEFWKDFGNLQADGCDFVCRSADARSSTPYKGVGDDQLEEADNRDDNLLPM